MIGKDRTKRDLASETISNAIGCLGFSTGSVEAVRDRRSTNGCLTGVGVGLYILWCPRNLVGCELLKSNNGVRLSLSDREILSWVALSFFTHYGSSSSVLCFSLLLCFLKRVCVLGWYARRQSELLGEDGWTECEWWEERGMGWALPLMRGRTEKH